MRVLQIARSFTRGGAAVGAENLTRALKSSGLEVITVAGDDACLSWYKKTIRIVERSLERLVFGTDIHCLKFTEPNINIEKEITRFRPDVLQLCDISANTIDCSKLIGLSLPVVHRMSDLWPHCGPMHYGVDERFTWLSKTLFRKLILSSGCIEPITLVAPSRWLAERVQTCVGMDRNVFFIRNSTPIFSGKKYIPRNFGSKGVRLGFIAMHVSEKRKGFSQLLEVLQHAFGRTSCGFSFEVVGSLKEQAKPRGLPFVVNYHGVFSRADKSIVFNNIDILLCPSEMDNSPNVACEALARGIPVIGQKGTGIESYVENKTSGMIVDFHSKESALLVESFVDAINVIVRSYSLYSKNAEEFANEELAHKSAGDQYKQLYNKLQANRVH